MKSYFFKRIPARNLVINALTFGTIFILTCCASATEVSFERDVFPILKEHCFECHGPQRQKNGYRLDVREIALQGGDSGEAAIVPTDAGSSPLVRYISSQDAGDRMPPEDSGIDPLTSQEIAILRNWVDAGAVWPDQLAGTTTQSPLWSLSPLLRPDVPLSSEDHKYTNPIDSFIAVKLLAHDLSIGRQADATTLVRRVTFDLTGLPPTPEEVEAFLGECHDASVANDAYQRLIDRLLDSPRYGERWARHWLDVVRFAESDGFETNQPRPNAWRYRDYVIDAFNADKPYDQFIREQLAGDALGADVATGFIVGGPWDRVKSPDPVLTAQQRSDELHDMVATTGSVFLGLTVGCARCHPHKFDPISHTDYFAMVACLSGVRHGERPLVRKIEADQRQMIDELRRQQAERMAAADELIPIAEPLQTEPRREKVKAQRNVERIKPILAKHVRFQITKTTNDLEPCIDELEIWTDDGRNVALKSKLSSLSDYQGNPKHRLEHINDGLYGNSQSWIAGTAGTGWFELELPEPESIVRIVWGRDRLNEFPDRLAVGYQVDVSEDSLAWQTVANANDRTPYNADASIAKQEPSTLDSEQRAAWLQNQAELAEIEKKIAELTSSPMVYAGTFESPQPTHRLSRGDPMQPKEVVAAGGLASVGTPLVIPPDATEQQRRIMLANWIADPKHPLTARVLVNRLWQYHFGIGLVDTPSDFGRNGGKPSHPELLDWLACELISSGWSIKRLNNLIITSMTYRQSSLFNAGAASIDADNRLLWRFPSRRLEAEALRDSILFVSGQIDLHAGGPGFDLFEPNTNYVKVYETKTRFGDGDFRRMVYQSKPRVELDSLFGAFDCPDAGQIQPKRNISITPLQALNLLNSQFMLDQSQVFAARVAREAGTDRQAQIRCAFQHAFNRDPSSEEATISETLIDQHGIIVFCRALYNTNEFIVVR